MKALLFAVCCIALSAVAAEPMGTVEHMERAKSSPTLKVWVKIERERLTPQNAGYRMSGPEDLCEVMKSVGLGCSYNERGDLVQYLAAQGVGLFPCEGGTNPYTRDMCGRMFDSGIAGADSFYNYIGQPKQNALLKKSIEKNRGLFKNGDLTAAVARSWKK